MSEGKTPTRPTRALTDASIFEDPSTCSHPEWVPYRKRVLIREPLCMLATVFAWCPRCNEMRQGPTEDGM